MEDTAGPTAKGAGPRPLLSLIGVVFALGFANLPISRWMDEFASTSHLVAHEVVWWAAVGAVLAWVALAERRALSSIGFRAVRKTDPFLALAGAIVMIAGLAFIYYVVFPRLGVSESREVDRLVATPLWWRIVSVVRAGVSEEVMFRGYAIERGRELTGSVGLASAVSWAVFTVAHVGPWGWGHLLIAGYGGLVLTALYLWRKNLWVNILAHVIVDAVAVMSG
jgi:membrane protease YdiL (CAAX protease family)